MIADAKAHQADDKKKKEIADLKNNADGLIYTTEKSLEEYASLLSERDRDEIKADMEFLKSRLNTTDPVALKDAITRLEGSAYRIADAIYADQQKAGA